ncbi:MAG: phosphatase PAP2 family protein [Spirochaetales bacterium]|nr:phosphatase PAP2 family protein [Spirochaetales bacterium]
MKSITGKLATAALLHYLAYIVMQSLALFAETRRGPSLPDLILDQFPARRHWDFFNSTIWLPALLGCIVLLLFLRPHSALAYLRVGAAVSVLRGIFISLTSLGPPEGLRQASPAAFLDFGPENLSFSLFLRQWLPLDVFWGGSGLSAAYLTQDLFFSGHTASTFLLLLCLRNGDRLFWPFLLYHILSVFFIIYTHEHYSIDILGAYFITYAVYVFFERKGWINVRAEPAASREQFLR